MLNLPKIVAHRCNTREAVKKAAAIGVKAIEIDVHTSIDGYAVVTHDEYCDIGRVASRTAHDLNNAGIPLLGEILGYAGNYGLSVIIEIKPDGNPHRSACAVNRCISDKSYVASFDKDILRMCSGQKILNVWKMPVVVDPYIKGIMCHADAVTAHDITVGAFTVNDQMTGHRLLKEIDFIITDNPEYFA